MPGLRLGLGRRLQNATARMPGQSTTEITDENGIASAATVTSTEGADHQARLAAVILN